MANGRINFGKQSGGVLSLTFPDGAANTEVTLPESGTLATTAGATESAQGLIELATTAEAQAGTDDSRAITPLKLFNSLKGGKQSLLTNGYQKLHGGLIIQWGKNTYTAGVKEVVFPLAFPTAVFNAQLVMEYAAVLDYSACTTGIPTLTGFTAYQNAPVSAPFYWFAIGY